MSVITYVGTITLHSVLTDTFLSVQSEYNIRIVPVLFYTALLIKIRSILLITVSFKVSPTSFKE